MITMKNLNAIRIKEELRYNYEWSNTELQKGHVYVVINDNYTATVRNLKEFLNLLEKENTTGELEIVSSVAVTESFLYGVQFIIEQYKLTMKKAAAEQAIIKELLLDNIQAIEGKINNTSLLKDEVKFNNTELNSYLFKEYTYMKQVLQTVVDKFYSRHYEIPAFIPFTEGDFDLAMENLKTVLRNFKKLIKFI